MFRRTLLAAIVAALGSLVFATGALGGGYSTAWFAPNGGASVKGDTVTLDNVAGAPAVGVSYETYDVQIPVQAGDTVSFEYKGPCGGGAPRVFIMGGAFNTFDFYTGQCGTPLKNGWLRVSRPYKGVAGDAGYVGIVNDQIAARSVIQVRHVRVANVELSLKDQAYRAFWIAPYGGRRRARQQSARRAG
jgi:hypothetical protein